MSYQGGGWTRILACGGRGGGREQPWTTWDHNDYYTVRHDVLQLAANATQARRPRKLPFRKLPFRKLPSRKLPFRKLLSGNFHSGACDVEIFRQARRAQSSLLGPALAQRSWPLRCTSALTSSRRSQSRRSPGRHQSCTFGRHGAAQALLPVHDRVDGHMRTVLCWAGPGDSCICMPGFIQHAPAMSMRRRVGDRIPP